MLPVFLRSLVPTPSDVLAPIRAPLNATQEPSSLRDGDAQPFIPASVASVTAAVALTVGQQGGNRLGNRRSSASARLEMQAAELPTPIAQRASRVAIEVPASPVCSALQGDPARAASPTRARRWSLPSINVVSNALVSFFRNDNRNRREGVYTGGVARDGTDITEVTPVYGNEGVPTPRMHVPHATKADSKPGPKAPVFKRGASHNAQRLPTQRRVSIPLSTRSSGVAGITGASGLDDTARDECVLPGHRPSSREAARVPPRFHPALWLEYP